MITAQKMYNISTLWSLSSTCVHMRCIHVSQTVCGWDWAAATLQDNNYRFDIAHRRTEDSAVAEHFNSRHSSKQTWWLWWLTNYKALTPACERWGNAGGSGLGGTSAPAGMNLRVDSLSSLPDSTCGHLWIVIPPELTSSLWLQKNIRLFVYIT